MGTGEGGHFLKGNRASGQSLQVIGGVHDRRRRKEKNKTKIRGKTVIVVGKLEIHRAQAHHKIPQRRSPLGPRSCLGKLDAKFNRLNQFRASPKASSSKAISFSRPQGRYQKLPTTTPTPSNRLTPTLSSQSFKVGSLSDVGETMQGIDEALSDVSLDHVNLSHRCLEHVIGIQSHNVNISKALRPYTRYPPISAILREVDENIILNKYKDLFATPGHFSDEYGSETNQILRDMLRALSDVSEGLEWFSFMATGIASAYGNGEISPPTSSTTERLSEDFKKIKEGFLYFEDLCQNLYDEQSDQESLVDENYEAKLHSFELIRSASTAFNRQLREFSRTCRAHQVHRIYIGLGAESQIDDGLQSVRFRLAFGFAETGHNETKWFQAQSDFRPRGNGTMTMSQVEKKSSSSHRRHRGTIASVTKEALRPRKESNSRVSKLPNRSTPPKLRKSQLAPASCMQWLENEPFRLSHSPQTQNWLRLDKSSRLAEGQPIQLSNLIEREPYMRISTRVRLAKAIAEGLLKFNPGVWSHSEMMSEDMIIICPLSGQDYEPHFHVRLVNPNDLDNIPLPDQHICGQPCGEILRKLYRTLLELAGDAGNDEIGDRGNERVGRSAKVRGGPRLKDLGSFYTDAVQYCRSLSDDPRSIYDPDIQLEFYQNVVLALESAENSTRLDR